MIDASTVVKHMSQMADEDWQQFFIHPQATGVIESYLTVLDLAKKHGLTSIERGAQLWLDTVNEQIKRHQPPLNS